ncbi:MAG TPA: SufS family cysteine desulfurase [Tepidisphaeraceae bacterium]|nr:SufS family cysteine desulfurase [Tepidisphaeraceae bacterium]
MFDVHKIREDFPILRQQVHGKPLAYLDNAATTQKPRAVIDRLVRYYESENANIHRGVYELSQRATTAYEEARGKVARFLNAPESAEVIFTRGTTEAINLVASSFGRAFLKRGDEIILSAMEHHSNIVPWQLVAEQTGAVIRVIPMNDAGELLMDEYERLLNNRTRIVSVVHVSNSLGTVNDVKRITELAHRTGARVLIDGAQWVAHHRTDVRDLGCDFYAFSGHKLFGPTGIGALWGRRELLETMPPYHGGGDMIESVTFEKTIYAQLPNRFEAGTPDIAGAIGLGAAIDYIQSIGFESFEAHEAALLKHATQQLSKIPGLRLIGTANKKGGVISFVVDDPPISSLDLGTRLDHLGIAVRTGHHCCQPVMDRMRVPATVRASVTLYNTIEEIDALVAGIRRIIADEGSRKSKSQARPAPSRLALQFPEPAAASPQSAAEKLIEDFDFMGDWDEKYQYLISLGDKLPFMPPDLKTEANRVRGCQSTVHLFARRRPGTDDELDFLADSDADIVRGLIAVLEMVFAGQSAREVLAFDIEAFLKRLGLDQYLSMGRRNGLASMIQRIRAFASAFTGAAAPVK